MAGDPTDSRRGEGADPPSDPGRPRSKPATSGVFLTTQADVVHLCVESVPARDAVVNMTSAHAFKKQVNGG